MRTLVSVGAAALLVLTLAGCSSPNSAPDAGCTTAPSGPASEAVSVTGDFNTHPTTKFTAPLSVQSTQRSVLTEGDGEEVTKGSTAVANVTIYNGTNGTELFSTAAAGGTVWELPIEEGVLISSLYDSLQCTKVGSRLAIVSTPADAFGTSGQPELGLGATDPVLFVVDINKVQAATPELTTDQTRATGAPQAPQPGLPTVTLANDGAPTVSIPESAPPTELTIAALKKGDGPKVEPGQSVIVQYQGVNWRTKAVFDQSWGQGAVTMDPARTIAGFQSAIVGQTVGSQVLVVIPPSQGYGAAGNPAADIQGTDTIVFVIDILAAG